MLPHWFWLVQFYTPEGGGETLVVAPHRAAAKKSIASSVSIVEYESVEPTHQVSDWVAAQHFDGYFPTTRAVAERIRGK